MTELLATATARTLTAWRRQRGQDTPAPLLALETHGRADVDIRPDPTQPTPATRSDCSARSTRCASLRRRAPTWRRDPRRSASITRCCGTCAPIPPNGSSAPRSAGAAELPGSHPRRASATRAARPRTVGRRATSCPNPTAVRHELTIMAAGSTGAASAECSAPSGARCPTSCPPPTSLRCRRCGWTLCER